MRLSSISFQYRFFLPLSFQITNQQPQTAHKCLPHVNNFFPHPHNCNYFIYCIKGYETIQQCPFYYGWDIERRTCVHMKQAKCYANTN